MILFPSKLISLVTTIGYFNLIAFNNPSGNFASSVSRTARAVVPLGEQVNVSTCKYSQFFKHSRTRI